MNTLICLTLIVLALGIACAVWLAAHTRGPGIGARRSRHPLNPQCVDPYAFPFGDVPHTGFTAAQLEQIARPSYARKARDPLNRTLDISPSAGALRRIAGGSHSHHPSGVSAVRTFFLQRLR